MKTIEKMETIFNLLPYSDIKELYGVGLEKDEIQVILDTIECEGVPLDIIVCYKPVGKTTQHIRIEVRFEYFGKETPVEYGMIRLLMCN